MLDHADLQREMNADRALASALLFSHRHPQASPAFHIGVIDIWRAADEFAAIMAFRQGAKTTLSEEFLLEEALFSNFYYTLIFGETYTKACQRIESMKHELYTNLAIREIFGVQKLRTHTENKIVLANNVCIEAHGWEEEIRGYLHLDKRPDRAYLDDIETEERVRDSATVDKQWRKLHKQLLPAMDKQNRKVRMTGTPLADDCMIMRAIKSPNWVHGIFAICDRDPNDPDAVSLWPERYPIEWIRSELKRFTDEGLLREFNQEYLLIPAGAVGKPFTEELLAFEDVAPLAYCPKVVIMDPARTDDPKKSDNTGFVVVSQLGSRIYVHASGARLWLPDAIIDGAFDLSEEFGDAEVAIEKNSLDEWLLQPMRNQMLKRGKVLNLKVMNAPQDRNKQQFIMGLLPFFKGHDIVLVGGRSKHPQLVSQLLNFPSGKKDVINALAYALRVFSGVPLYRDFSERNIRQSPITLPRGGLYLIGCHATSTETCCFVALLDGSHLTVLREFTSPLNPAEAIKEFSLLLRAAYPGKTFAVWVPADVYDQVGRNPLIAALKVHNLRPSRGDHTVLCRGILGDWLRTDMRNQRLLTVSTEAPQMLQGLASGYHYPLLPDGTRGAEPTRNVTRTLIEALEVLTQAIIKQDTATTFTPNSYNASGTPYMSALGNGRTP
jgi:hypothetical protein